MLLKKLRKFSHEETKNSIVKIGPELDFSTSEAYNLLRTNLSFAFPGKTDGRRIGVTSSAPEEGKSYTAANLAYSLAKDGQKVLLIDADMRKPTVAEKLRIKHTPGLSNQLVDRSGQSFIQEGVMHENLSVLAAGDIPPNPSEMVGSDEMSRLLKEYASQYDYVIVDMPPVMEVPDPLIMAKDLDGIVLAVMHERSYRSEIKESVRKLRFVNARILGFVYNGYTSTTGRKHRKYKRRTKKIKQ